MQVFSAMMVFLCLPLTVRNIRYMDGVQRTPIGRMASSGRPSTLGYKPIGRQWKNKNLNLHLWKSPADPQRLRTHPGAASLMNRLSGMYGQEHNAFYNLYLCSLCDDTVEPVCSTLLNTYDNECQLKYCSNIDDDETKLSDGPCENPSGCGCEEGHVDVMCGTDDRTYISPCRMYFSGKQMKASGPCRNIRRIKGSTLFRTAYDKKKGLIGRTLTYDIDDYLDDEAVTSNEDQFEDQDIAFNPLDGAGIQNNHHGNTFESSEEHKDNVHPEINSGEELRRIKRGAKTYTLVKPNLAYRRKQLLEGLHSEQEEDYGEQIHKHDYFPKTDYPHPINTNDNSRKTKRKPYKVDTYGEHERYARETDRDKRYTSNKRYRLKDGKLTPQTIAREKLPKNRRRP